MRIIKKIDFLKTLKIVIGCCLGFLLAEALRLHHATSAVVITLLSILNTKKETLHAAGKRILSFLSAAVIGSLLFYAFDYSLFSLAVYLLLCHIICQAGDFTEGFSMSTVLMLHIWNARAVSVSLLLNEFSLMLIGISMAILMNLYMPNRISHIRRAQREIEEKMSQILFEMSRAVFQENLSDSIKKKLDELEILIADSLYHAQYTEKNFLFKDMSYYVSYIKMRTDQIQLLKRIYKNLPRLQESYAQTNLVSKFMRITAISMDEYNNASDLLNYLESMRKHFQEAPLPASRREFESRAVLYEIVKELQDLLLLKQTFANSLTLRQIETFWR